MIITVLMDLAICFHCLVYYFALYWVVLACFWLQVIHHLKISYFYFMNFLDCSSSFLTCLFTEVESHSFLTYYHFHCHSHSYYFSLLFMIKLSACYCYNFNHSYLYLYHYLNHHYYIHFNYCYWLNLISYQIY